MTEQTVRVPKVHELKCWPEFFHAIVCGEKTFEVRRADRDYAVGDMLVLREYQPQVGYTGCAFAVVVTYLADLHALLPGEGFVGMSIRPYSAERDNLPDYVITAVREAVRAAAGDMAQWQRDSRVTPEQMQRKIGPRR